MNWAKRGGSVSGRALARISRRDLVTSCADSGGDPAVAPPRRPRQRAVDAADAAETDRAGMQEGLTAAVGGGAR
jgi:hypothetical protein